jgi:hypothetical protein
VGFVVQRRRFKLVFADGSALDGATVRMRSVDLGVYMECMRLAQVGMAMKDADDLSVAELMTALPEVARLFEVVADSLVDWDLQEEDGTPIPCTFKGLCSLEPPMVYVLVESWMEAIGGVSAPLPNGSRSGGPAPAVSLPMEVSSAPQAN